MKDLKEGGRKEGRNRKKEDNKDWRRRTGMQEEKMQGERKN